MLYQLRSVLISTFVLRSQSSETRKDPGTKCRVRFRLNTAKTETAGITQEFPLPRKHEYMESLKGFGFDRESFTGLRDDFRLNEARTTDQCLEVMGFSDAAFRWIEEKTGHCSLKDHDDPEIKKGCHGTKKACDSAGTGCKWILGYSDGGTSLKDKTVASLNSMCTMDENKKLTRKKVRGYELLRVKTVYLYTDNKLPFFWLMNSELRKKEGTLPPNHKFYKYVQCLVVAIMLCPQHTEVVYRSRKLPKKIDYVGKDKWDGDSYTTTQFTSCSTKRQAAEQADTAGKSNGNMVVTSLTVDPRAPNVADHAMARSIKRCSRYPREEEVLFAPHVPLRVTRRTETDATGRRLARETDLSKIKGDVSQRVKLTTEHKVPEGK